MTHSTRIAGIAGIAAFVLVSSIAAADTKIYPDAKLQVSFPDGWKIKDAKNGVTLVGAPADDAGVIAFSQVNPTPDTVKTAVDALVAAMNITAVVWSDQLVKDMVNKLPLFLRKGTGTADGKADDLAAILVMNGSAGLVMITIVRHDRKAAYTSALAATLLSVQPTK